MNAICIMLAGLFAWCVLTAGHATYQVNPVPAAATSIARP